MRKCLATQPSRPTTLRSCRRRGVALMVVMGLLSMLMLVAVAFVVSASAHRESAQTASHVETMGDQPDQLLHRAIYEIVRGSRNPMSVVGPHGLLEDMYGNDDSVIGAIVAAQGSDGPHDSMPTSSSGSPGTSNRLSQLTQATNRTTYGQFIELRVVSFGPDKQPGVAFVDDDGNGVADDLSDLSNGITQAMDDRVLGDTSKGVAPIVDAVEGYYAGRVMTILDGPAKNESVRIVRYFDYNHVTDLESAGRPMNFHLVVSRPKNGQPIVTSPLDMVRVVINGREFNGAGFGYTSEARLPTGVKLGLNPATLEAKFSDATSAPIAPYATVNDPATWPYAYTPNPREESYRDFLRTTPVNGFKHNIFGVHADEDYDAPDFQNMMLAGAVWSPEVGRKHPWLVRIPSLHRPELVAMHMRGLGANLRSILDRDAGMDGGSTGWHHVLTGGPSPNQRLRQKLILRPDPQDHVSNPTVTWRPGMQEWSGNMFFNPIHGPWDVDNDADGEPDSIWVDLGLPVQYNENGKMYKPLFAILCLDLDGRFNVNAHGNWAHYASRLNTSPESGEGLDYASYGSFEADTGIPSAGTSYGLNVNFQKDSWGVEFYVLGMRTGGAIYAPSQIDSNRGQYSGMARFKQYELFTSLFNWGSWMSDRSLAPRHGGPYAGSLGYSLYPYAGNPTQGFPPPASGGNGNAYPGLPILTNYTQIYDRGAMWFEAGQGFSVAEVNLGGVLAPPSMVYGAKDPRLSVSEDMQRFPPSQINSYRILLEGEPVGGRNASGGRLPTLARNGEGRYGERGVVFAQAHPNNFSIFRHQFNEYNALFAPVINFNDRTKAVGFARPGLTFVDDNLPLPPTLGTGPESFAKLRWTSPDLTFDFSDTMAQLQMRNNAEYGTLMVRGNRFTEASTTFWDHPKKESIPQADYRTSPGQQELVGMQGVGNYGFYVDPTGQMGMALDFRGVPYPNRRGSSVPRDRGNGSPSFALPPGANRYPSYVGDSWSSSTTNIASGRFGNVWQAVGPGGAAVHVPWQRQIKWFRGVPSTDDPWEMDLYYTPRAERAFHLQGGGAEQPINPLNRSYNWFLATAATRRYPRGIPTQLPFSNAADDFPEPPAVDRQAVYYVDRPFTFGELEPLLRPDENDSLAPASRLATFMPLHYSGQNTHLRRWLVTTDSWDLPTPNVTAPPEIGLALEFRGFNYRTTNLTFADLLRGKFLAAQMFAKKNDGSLGTPSPLAPTLQDYSGLTPAEISTYMAKARQHLWQATRPGPNQLVPRDLLMGLRMDINRPFGNGLDDDFDGTVDDPPPPAPYMYHRAGPLNLTSKYTNASSSYPANKRLSGFLLSSGYFQPSPIYDPDNTDPPFDETTYPRGELNVMYSDTGNTNPNNSSQINPGNTSASRTGQGIAPEATNYRQIDSGLFLRERTANYDPGKDAWYPNTAAREMSRQEMAKHLYILAMLFNDLTWQYPFGGTTTGNSSTGLPNGGVAGAEDPLLNDDAKRRTFAAYRCAQWAVNCVDFRDRDAIMTPFEFDINPFIQDLPDSNSTWEVDGILDAPTLTWKVLQASMSMISQVDHGKDMEQLPPTFPEYAKMRGLVWGMEAPELLLTESMAFHDLRVADTESAGNMDVKTTATNPMVPDNTYDQARVPQGSLFVELYCAAARHAMPNPHHPDLGQFPPELYDIHTNDMLLPDHIAPGNSTIESREYNRSVRYGLLDLSRLAPPSGFDSNNNPIRAPVWRLAISDWHERGAASGSDSMNSVRNMLYGKSSPYYKPYSTTLGPVSNAANAAPALNWITNPGSQMQDTVATSMDLVNPQVVNLTRFVWFVDRWSLEVPPPPNVYCYYSSPESSPPNQPSGNRIAANGYHRPQRFLLEPGQYAVVGPERLDHNASNANQRPLPVQYFATVTAHTCYYKVSDGPGQGPQPGKDPMGMTPPGTGWFPAWFNLDVRSEKNSSRVRDLVNFIRGNNDVSRQRYDHRNYSYPVMFSPQQAWGLSLNPDVDVSTPAWSAQVRTPVSIPTANYHDLGFLKHSGVNISEPWRGYDKTIYRDTDHTDTDLIDVIAFLPDPLNSTDRNQDLKIVQRDGFDGAPPMGMAPRLPSEPFDGKMIGGNDEQNGSGTLVSAQYNMVMPGTYEDVRTIFLQRLANPLVAWHPVFNPYITVDWLPVDLTVYNGQHVWDPTWNINTTTELVKPITSVDQLTDSGTAPTPPRATSSATNKLFFSSRQRGPASDWTSEARGSDGVSSSVTVDELPLWPAMSQAPIQDDGPWEQGTGIAFPAGYTNGFRHDPICTLGYINHFYPRNYVSGLDPAPPTRPAKIPLQLGKMPLHIMSSAPNTTSQLLTYGNVMMTLNKPTDSTSNLAHLNSFRSDNQYVPAPVLCDYIGAPPRPFPWVTWLNRPFASQMELAMVPASSPSRFTTEYTYMTAPQRAISVDENFDYAQPRFFGTVASASGTGAPPQYMPLNETKLDTQFRWPYAHLLNFFSSSRPIDPAAIPQPTNQQQLNELFRPNFYRMLEYVHVPSRFTNAQEFVVPYSSWDEGANPLPANYDPAAEVFSPPFNFLSRFREPGRVNLNTFMGATMNNNEVDRPDDGADLERFRRRMIDPSQSVTPAQHWGALVNFTPMHNIHWEDFNRTRYAGDVNAWTKYNHQLGTGVLEGKTTSTPYPWVRTGSGSPKDRPVLFNTTRPSIYANPFRSYTNSLSVPHVVQQKRKNIDDIESFAGNDPMHRYADSSLLRWADRGYVEPSTGVSSHLSPSTLGANRNPANEGLFVTDGLTGTQNVVHHIHDSNRNPYFRYQDYIKLGSVATTRSNVYAAWITMGKFEVEAVQSINSKLPNYRDPATVMYTNPDGYRLVREMGSDLGDVNRHRAFMILDRSIPVGFVRGENLNVDKAIKLRRFID